MRLGITCKKTIVYRKFFDSDIDASVMKSTGDWWFITRLDLRRRNPVPINPNMIAIQLTCHSSNRVKSCEERFFGNSPALLCIPKIARQTEECRMWPRVRKRSACQVMSRQGIIDSLLFYLVRLSIGPKSDVPTRQTRAEWRCNDRCEDSVPPAMFTRLALLVERENSLWSDSHCFHSMNNQATSENK
jgi:hypothetical protein